MEINKYIENCNINKIDIKNYLLNLILNKKTKNFNKFSNFLNLEDLKSKKQIKIIKNKKLFFNIKKEYFYKKNDKSIDIYIKNNKKEKIKNLELPKTIEKLLKNNHQLIFKIKLIYENFIKK